MNTENIDELMNFDDNEFMQMEYTYTNAQLYILGNRSPMSITDVEQLEIPSRPILRRQIAIVIDR